LSDLNEGILSLKLPVRDETRYMLVDCICSSQLVVYNG